METSFLRSGSNFRTRASVITQKARESSKPGNRTKRQGPPPRDDRLGRLQNTPQFGLLSFMCFVCVFFVLLFFGGVFWGLGVWRGPQCNLLQKTMRLDVFSRANKGGEHINDTRVF